MAQKGGGGTLGLKRQRGRSRELSLHGSDVETAWADERAAITRGQELGRRAGP